MIPHPVRMTLATVAVALTFVYASGTLATDLPRKAYSGTISEIGKSSITVQGSKDDHRVFQVVTDTTIVAHGNANGKFSDLKVDDKVDVTYTEEGDKLVAHRIEVRSTGEP